MSKPDQTSKIRTPTSTPPKKELDWKRFEDWWHTKTNILRRDQLLIYRLVCSIPWVLGFIGLSGVLDILRCRWFVTMALWLIGLAVMAMLFRGDYKQAKSKRLELWWRPWGLVLCFSVLFLVDRTRQAFNSNTNQFSFAQPSATAVVGSKPAKKQIDNHEQEEDMHNPKELADLCYSKFLESNYTMAAHCFDSAKQLKTAIADNWKDVYPMYAGSLLLLGRTNEGWQQFQNMTNEIARAITEHTPFGRQVVIGNVLANLDHVRKRMDKSQLHQLNVITASVKSLQDQANP